MRSEKSGGGKNSGASSRAGWWILILAVLAVALGLVLLQVARPKEDRTPSKRAGSAEAMTPGRGGRGSAAWTGGTGRTGRTGRTGGAAPMDSRRGAGKTWPPVDRARLARLLARGKGHSAARDPEARGPGPGPDDDDDPTIWPLTAKGIKGAIRARISEIKECYDGWLADDDELGGKLVLAFTIKADPQGEHAQISSAEIQSSSLEHPGLERCVLVMAESLRFEPPHGGQITVRYPFRFRPTDD